MAPAKVYELVEKKVSKTLYVIHRFKKIVIYVLKKLLPANTFRQSFQLDFHLISYFYAKILR